MKEKQVKDERLQSQMHKSGYESFVIVFIGILITSSVKFFVFNMDFKSYIDTFLILMLACAYFTFRSIKNGLLISPNKAEEKKKFKRSYIIIWAAASALWGLLMFLYEISTTNNPINLTNTLIKIIVMSILFFFGITGLQLLFSKLSKKASEKDIE